MVSNCKDSNVNQGDIFQLGEHRLMCGDATCKDDASYLMNGDKGKILFTSPPYSDLRTYNGDKDLSINHLKHFISTFKEYTNHQVVNLGLKRSNFEIQCYWNDYINYARSVGYKLLAWNVWNKQTAGSIGYQRAFVPIYHEWIFIFGTEYYDINKTIKKKHKNKSLVTKRRQPDGSMKYSSTGDTSNHYKKMGSVQSIYPELGKIRGEHPAVFPVQLPLEYIKSLTNENDIVIDCFGGSGSTLIACEESNRSCYMMELDESYCQTIINRWENCTGGKAVKIGAL